MICRMRLMVLLRDWNSLAESLTRRPMVRYLQITLPIWKR